MEGRKFLTSWKQRGWGQGGDRSGGPGPEGAASQQKAPWPVQKPKTYSNDEQVVQPLKNNTKALNPNFLVCREDDPQDMVPWLPCPSKHVKQVRHRCGDRLSQGGGVTRSCSAHPKANKPPTHVRGKHLPSIPFSASLRDPIPRWCIKTIRTRLHLQIKQKTSSFLRRQ